MTEYSIRPARYDEIESLNLLIKESARGLSVSEYTPEEIEGLIEYVFGVDSELIEDQTYFVIVKDGAYAACGGWSKRQTLFGGDACQTRESGFLDPENDAAKVRAFFVHPSFARQGLAKLLMETCEEKARQQGFKSIELMSTLPGVKFYESQGFKGNQTIDYPLPNGLSIKFLPMTKSIKGN